MDKSAMIIPVIAGILGVLSAILGFAAEATRIKVDDLISTYWGCQHPYSPAFGLAIVAALLLVIAQIILAPSTGCCCKSRQVLLAGPFVWIAQAGGERNSVFFMITASWVTFVISCTNFINGAIKNTPGGQIDDVCVTVRGGIFASASILALATVGLGIGACFLFHGSQNPDVDHVIAVGNVQQYPQQAGNVQMQFQYPQQAGNDQMQFQAGNVEMQFRNPLQYPQQAGNSDQMQLQHAGNVQTQFQDSQQYPQQAGNDHTEFQQGNTSQNPSAQIQQHNNYPPPGTVPAG